jgi:hypothetical protein
MNRTDFWFHFFPFEDFEGFYGRLHLLACLLDSFVAPSRTKSSLMQDVDSGSAPPPNLIRPLVLVAQVGG